jgi:hypothetical protein
LSSYVDLSFRMYRVPKLGDPESAQFGVIDVNHLLITPTKEVPLSFTLGQALNLHKPSVPSQIVLLEPFKVIATDTEGKRWLLKVYRQDSRILIVGLKPASSTPKYDDLFWESLDEPVYTAHDSLLHEFLARHAGSQISSNPESDD